MSKVLVTGASGLIGSQCVEFFSEKGFEVFGIDNDMRAYFFGEDSSTLSVKEALENKIPNYKCYDTDIRDLSGLEKIFKEHKFEIIIHTAAQPSHDWAAREPLTDFGVNAVGTANLLELYRLHSPESVFIFTSTNKVYGDRPNSLMIEELDTNVLIILVTCILLTKQCLLTIVNILFLEHLK